MLTPTLITAAITSAIKAGISPVLLLAVCSVESNFTHTINVHDGGSPSYGICQIKHKTAKDFKLGITRSELLIPQQNLSIAARLLKRHLDRYNGDVSCAIAAYNLGSCKKNKNGKIWNRGYVKKVKKRMLWAAAKLVTTGVNEQGY